MLLCYDSIITLVSVIFVTLKSTTSFEDNEVIQCEKGQFMCKDEMCIEERWVCDGFSDCLDASDETLLQCANMRCPPGSFQCTYGGCIGGDKKCDGNVDCKDSSDEDLELCGYKGCPGKLFPCKNGQCIDQNRVCDRRKDCIDGSDEAFETCGVSKIKGNCVIPNQPLNGKHVPVDCYSEEQFSIDRRVNDGDEVCLEYSCNEGYVLDEFKQKYITKCVNGVWTPSPPSCIECGRNSRVHPLIFNPSATLTHPEPWHVAIYILNQTNQVYDYICGGSIVHSRAVVSAAHCFKMYLSHLNPYSILDRFNTDQIILGTGKRKRQLMVNESLQEVLQVEEIRHHTGFNFLFALDAAVIIVKKKIKMRESILMPVCIGIPEFYKKHSVNTTVVKGKVVGFGKTDTLGLSDDLLAAELTVCCGQTVCLERTRNVEDRKYITKDKFCVEIDNQGPRLGEGDSGGGFIIQSHHINYLYGIVSLNLAHEEFTLFTSISEVWNWLQETLEV